MTNPTTRGNSRASDTDGTARVDIGAGPRADEWGATNLTELETEFLKLEWQQAVETYRHMLGMLTGIWGFIIGANALLLAYAISQKAALLILVASGMPAALVLTYRRMLSHALPFAHAAIRLEEIILPGHKTLMAHYYESVYPKVLRNLDHEVRAQPVDSSALPVLFGSIAFFGMVAAGLCEVALFAMAVPLFGFHWL